MTSEKPILVTGFHRGGTTWVGKMLSSAPGLGYIHEPFNLITCHPAVCSAPFVHWWTYVTNDNELLYYKHIKKTVEFRCNLRAAIRATRSWRQLPRLVVVLNSVLSPRLRNSRPLIKDPVAFFSAEWLASKFDMQVVVMIRHPAAFVSSLIKLKWATQWPHWLNQPLLVRDHLYPFKTAIKKYAYKEHDPLDNAILTWRILHHVMEKYKQNQQNWLFIRHEDLSRDPIKGFQRLFGELNLDFSEDARAVIMDYCSCANTNEPGGPWDVRRDSKANLAIWKERLSKEEILKVRLKLEDISSDYYSDEDW